MHTEALFFIISSEHLFTPCAMHVRAVMAKKLTLLKEIKVFAKCGHND